MKNDLKHDAGKNLLAQSSELTGISSSNIAGIKTLNFSKPALIFVTKLAMTKNPFKRNPYLRDKTG